MELTAPSEHWEWLRNRTEFRLRAPGCAKDGRDRNPLPAATSVNISWRNSRKSWLSCLACLFMITVPPTLTVLCWIALEHFKGSLFGALTELIELGPSLFAKQFAPIHDRRVTVAYFGWVLFQALLYTVLPGKSTGQLTAGGELLDYPTNGFLAWSITVSAFAVLTLSGTINPCIIARHWGSLVVTFNIYGYALSVGAYLKAYYAPSHPEGRTFSGKYPFQSSLLPFSLERVSDRGLGSVLYDFLMGIELNPRFGQHWDWKLFHNGRPGIIGWTLM